MRILVATDAWPPQVNGVVRTLQSLAANVRKLGAEIEFMRPEGFRTFPLPTDRNVRCAIPTWREIARRIEFAAPDALHIATEGPIGHFVRRYCLVQKIPFTTSYMTRFPEYVSARLPIPLSWTYAALRRFHAAAAVTMVSTRSLIEELGNRGFAHLAMWTRGVDTDLFPDRAIASDLPRPILSALAGSQSKRTCRHFWHSISPARKSSLATGRRRASCKPLSQSPFSWSAGGETLAAHLAAADVFVFPSRTDTFGLFQLEALACGVPVAAYPVPGPKMYRQQSGRRARRGSQIRRPQSSDDFAGGMPRLCAHPILGTKRVAVHFALSAVSTLRTAWTCRPRQQGSCNPYSASVVRQETDIHPSRPRVI